MMKDFKCIVYSVMSIFLLLGASTAYGLVVNEVLKVTASDEALGDYYGKSVAVSGNTAIVGASENDDAGVSSGSAYLLDATTGVQQFKLTAGDALAGDQFGWSVAVSGNTAIVGSPYSSDTGNVPNGTTGGAYLFDATTGNQLFKLNASDGSMSDAFGYSVAISGNTAIVGAQYDDDYGSQSGSAYLFDINTGNQLFKLTASDGAAYDYFGRSVAISGNIAIVGCAEDDDNGLSSGSAYLFDVTTGLEINKLTASDAASGDKFGDAVAIDGNIAIIGAYGDLYGGVASGSAYLFDVTTGNELDKLIASDAGTSDWFGRSVAIDGNTAIVGAMLNLAGGVGSGSAFIFAVGTGNEVAKLLPSDGAAGDWFGISVGVNGNAVIVGSQYYDGVGGNSGSAYLFDGSVPEPTSAVMLLAGCGALFGRKRVA